MVYLTPLIVPVLNNFEGFTRLITSVVGNAIFPIVIPNYESYNSVAGSWNKGLKIASDAGDSVAIIANDDTVLEEGSLDKLIATMIDTNSIFAFPKDAGSAFAFFAVDIQKMQNLGGFDERFSPAYFEDNDALYRAKLAGLNYVFCNEVVVTHEGSATQFRNPQNPVVSHERFRELQELYIAKWGGLPGSEVYITPFNVDDFEFGINSEFVRQRVSNLNAPEVLKEYVRGLLRDVMNDKVPRPDIFIEFNEVTIAWADSKIGYLETAVGSRVPSFVYHKPPNKYQEVSMFSTTADEWIDGDKVETGCPPEAITEYIKSALVEAYKNA